MIRELEQHEVEAVAGGPIWFGLLVVPAVKLSGAMKIAALTIGAAAGAAGAQAALSENE